MEHKEVKLVKKTIHKEDSNHAFAEMLVPEGWQASISEDRDDYGGYEYPYTFRIKLTSNDGTMAIYYFSPRSYLDDHQNEFTNGGIDEDGNLYRRSETIEEYLGNWAYNDLKQFVDPKEIDSITYPEIQELGNKYRKEAEERVRNKNQELIDFGYDRLSKVYAYRYKETDRIRIYSGQIEKERINTYSYIPVPDNVVDRSQTIRNMYDAFPDAVYDSRRQIFIRRSSDKTYWRAISLLVFDCMAKDYEYAYQKIFSPIFDNGVTICDDILNDFKKIKEEIDSRNRQESWDKKIV